MGMIRTRFVDLEAPVFHRLEVSQIPVQTWGMLASMATTECLLTRAQAIS
jgi:hypothetical protein